MINVSTNVIMKVTSQAFRPRQIQRGFRFSLRHRGGGGNEPSCGGVYDPVVPMGNVASEEVNAALVYA